jgi:hypothetical protein
VVLLYDHLLTLDDEVKYVWSAPGTIAKVLFLTLRYMVPLFLTGQTISTPNESLSVHLLMLISPHWYRGYPNV